MPPNPAIAELESALSLVEWVKKYSSDFGAQTRAHHASEKISNAILSLKQDQALEKYLSFGNVDFRHEEEKETNPVHLCYYKTNQIAKVGDIATFGKNGACRILEIKNGEAEGENLITKEICHSFVSDLDFIS
jgi:hypothetical protein